MKKLFFLTLCTVIIHSPLSFAEIFTVDTEPPEPTDPKELYIRTVRKEITLGKKYRLTMLTPERLDNIEYCMKEILEDGIPGDCVETGVWRGGATILMRAILKAYQDSDRLVWVVDSFEGLPTPNLARYPADAEFLKFKQGTFGVPLETVMNNFARFNLLDNRVVFVKGWFSETLPTAPIEQISLLRLDGDLYESTMDALNSLYHKVSPGGFIIIDDYGCFKACALAVEDFRKEHGIEEPLHIIDFTGVYWRKSK